MKPFVALALLAAVAAPALADKPEGRKGANLDPNRMICRTEQNTGSRLSSSKRCMTAQQWADQRLADRQVVERSQGGGWKSGTQ